MARQRAPLGAPGALCLFAAPLGGYLHAGLEPATIAVRGEFAVPAGIPSHRRVHAPREEKNIVIHHLRRLAAVLVGAGVAALTLTALAGATHLQGFGHANPVAAGGQTSTSCTVDSECLSVTNTSAT